MKYAKVPVSIEHCLRYKFNELAQLSIVLRLNKCPFGGKCSWQIKEKCKEYSSDRITAMSFQYIS